jgi:F0F1-type ATP synthase assembly protein I
LLLLGSLGILFLIHLQAQLYLNIPSGSDMLLLSYVLNFILALAIFIGLFALRNRLKNQIGFLYMGGSMLKFLVFFLVFYPGYRADGIVSKSEFAAFFVPYLLCLILETVYTAKMLNTLK